MKKTRRNGLVIMARLITILGNFAYILLLAVLMGVLGFGCAMGVTIFGSLGVAKYLGEDIALPYGWIIALTVGCGVLRGGLRYFEQYGNHYIAFKLLAVLRDKIFAALRKLAPAKLESKQKGSIVSMITSDIETLEVFYAHTISPVCIALIVSTVIFLFVGFMSSWYLALVALFAYIMIGIIVPLISSAMLKTTGVKYRQEFASFNSYYLDSIKGVKDIVLNNAEEERGKEVNQRSDELLKETKVLKHKSTAAAALTELVVTLIIALTLTIGILLVINNNLSVGRMIIGVVAIFSSFGPVIALSALPSNLTQTFASGDRVLDLIDEKPVVEEIKDKQDFTFNSLEIKDLSFSYSKDEPVLKNISMTVNKGEVIGIVGESGCGKSTLLKLLLRFWKKDSGEILYNGTDIEEINTASLLNNVTMVCQSTYLFDDTIRENLKIAKPDATDEEIKEACKLASIDEFISQLPDGYDSRVGALGDNVSAGEKQRIGLARAFLKGSQLILLDEPTSNVDSMNEGIILKSLAQQKGKKTIILVSHRESTMAIADKIYHIENGEIK